MNIVLIVEKKIVNKDQINELKTYKGLSLIYLDKLAESFNSLNLIKTELIILFTDNILKSNSKNFLTILKKIKRIKTFFVEISIKKAKLESRKTYSNSLIHGFESISFALVKKIIESKNEK